MLKLTGIVLVIASCTFAGFWLTEQYSQRVRLLQECILMVKNISYELRFSAASPIQIVESLAERKGAVSLLKRCREYCLKGDPFPMAWEQAAERELGELKEEEYRCLCTVGQVLGSCDVESQQDALLYTQKRLEGILEEARNELKNQSKLYRGLGLLSGCLLAVLLC